MRTITNIFETVDKILFAISGFTMFVMMLWIFIDVMLRAFFNSPLTGTIEITGEYLMVLMVYLSLSYTHKYNGHVKVTFLEDRFSKKVKSIITFILNIFAAFLFIMIGSLNFKEGLSYMEQNITSVGILGYPLAPALFIISIGTIMIAIRLLLQCALIALSKESLEKNDNSVNTEHKAI